MASKSRRVLLIGATFVAAGVGVYLLTSLSPRTARDDTDCTPEGGLRCVDGAIHICDGGQTRKAGDCAGGCVDERGIARCTGKDGTLLAPAGAICQAGMAVCAVESKALLVCRDGRLAVGAECPNGCVDQGEQGSLYCLDEHEGIRFAPGFPCPNFYRDDIQHTCGPDGQSLLRCENGLLVEHEVACAICAQRKGGSLTCLDAAGVRLDPATGEALPPEPPPEPEPEPKPRPGSQPEQEEKQEAELESEQEPRSEREPAPESDTEQEPEPQPGGAPEREPESGVP